MAIHDATLDRTTTCTGEVRTFTLAELAGCRIDFPAGKPARMITIRSLLDYARKAGATVNLEIKNVPSDPDYDSTPAYANRVMDAVVASRIPRSQLIIQSFVPANLDVAVQRLPGVATSLLSLQALNEAYLQLAFDKDYDIISPEWPVTRGLRAPRARQRARRDPVHARHGDGRARRASGQGRRADHRRSARGGPRDGATPGAVLRRLGVHRRRAA